MWPGSNPPMGPPPPGLPAGPGAGQGSGWAPPRPPGPGPGWYALPAALLVVAAVGFFGVLAFLWDDSEAADGPSASGDPAAGVTVELTEGYGYFIYVRSGEATPFSCSVKVEGRSGPIPLTRQNSWSASDHAGYRYTATFEAPVSGAALLTCRGTDGPILVTPDDTSHAYLGFAFIAAVVLGALSIVSFVYLVVRRGSAKRKAAPAPFPGPGPRPGPYGY